MNSIAYVVIEGAANSFDKRYTYSIPNSLSALAKAGCRVCVPFGRGNIEKQGMILSVEKTDNVKKLKPIYSLTDSEPILSDELLKLAVWMKEHIFCTYFDAINAMLPLGVRFKITEFLSAEKRFSGEISDKDREIFEYILNNNNVTSEELKANFENFDKILSGLIKSGAVVKESKAKRNLKDLTSKHLKICEGATLNNIKLTARQEEIFNLIGEIGSASVKEVKYFTGVTDSVIKALISKGLLEIYQREEFRLPYTLTEKPNREDIILTDEQQGAFEGLKNQLSLNKPQYSLLYGVTGSGKTQVFLRLVDEALDSNKGVIIMVPEIALTPQMLGIFTKRYGSKIAVFHSAMSQGQRLDEYKRIKQGKAQIAIGTRTAVFAPFENLGLIIIDEEQEHTYKSEKSPRFNARDIAKFRIAYNKGLLCLASATPSVESYSLALNGNIKLYTLSRRYGNAKLPTVTVVDMKKEILNGNSLNLSCELAAAIGDELDNHKQIVLLLNRRGHNTYITCPKCGYIATCPNCSISLTYHSANKRLMCHYCGHSENAPSKCPECGAEHLAFLGAGTQKLQEELSLLFPNASVLRLDADTTASRDSFSSSLKDFADKKYDILLGTQMVAKGLDFPDVSLVGVIGADYALYSDDYKGFERTFSLITQVIGRAGRAGGSARAIIQTIDPENSVIELAKAQDYDAFYRQEIANRKLMIYPPFCDICMVAVSSMDKNYALSLINEIFSNIKNSIKDEYKDIKLIILGPCAASVPKVNNRYRYRMIIKCKNNEKFREMLNAAIPVKLKGDTAVFVDINPENVL